MNPEVAVAIWFIVIVGGALALLLWNVVRAWRESAAEVRELDRKRGGPPLRPSRRQDPDSVTGTGLDGLL